MPKLQYTNKTDFPLSLRLPGIWDIIPFPLLILASRCSFMGIRPFALSMFCGAFDLRTGYLGILAAILGFISVGKTNDAVPHLISMLIFWLYSRPNPHYEKQHTKSASLCGITLFICRIVQEIYGEINLYTAIIIFAESLTCTAGYILFRKASSLVRYSRTPPTEQELVSGAVCTGIFISGLSGITVPPGLEISRIISGYAVMCISLSMPLSVAGSCGVSAGLICSINSYNAIILTGLYGLSSIVYRG